MAQMNQEAVYLLDVRTREEYAAGHIPGFRWFPGGQAVQRSDDVVGVKDGSVVFACDGAVRSTVAASWYRQLGYPNVHVLRGGVTTWKAAGHAEKVGMPDPSPFGLAKARSQAHLVAPHELQGAPDRTVLFVGTSREFAAGHVPGASWVPRGWLEIQVADLAPDRELPLVVTCSDGVASCLAAATLAEMEYRDVWVLDGGMASWMEEGLAVERGLTGVMTPPNDVVPAGPDRGSADMMNYLRWEEELGRKYEGQAL